MRVNRVWVMAALVCGALGAGCADDPAPVSSTRPSGVLPSPGTGPLTPTKTKALQKILDDAVSLSQGFPLNSEASTTTGVIAAIVTDQGTWAGAAGVDGCDQKLQPTGMFEVGSTTKTFVAAEVMHLVAAGRVDLDAPLANYVKAPLARSAGTVRQTLGMRNGIRDRDKTTAADYTQGHEPDYRWTPDEALTVWAAAPVTDTEYSYANTNYILLGMLLTSVTDEPVAVSLRRDLIAPAGLTRVAVQDAEAPTAPVVQPGWLFQKAMVYRCGQSDVFIPTRSVASFVSTAGAIAADAPSLARWGYQLYGGRVLPPARIAEMTGPPPSSRTHEYGLGTERWVSAGGYEVVGHTGQLDGYDTLLAVIPGRHFALAAMFPRSDRADELESLSNNLIAEALKLR